MAPEVAQRCVGGIELGRFAHSLHTGNLVGNTFGFAAEVCLDIRASFDDIAGDVESVARCLGDSEAVIEGDATWDSAETNNHTPHLVDCKSARAHAGGAVRGNLKGFFETSGDNDGHDSSGELAKTLHCKD